MRAAISSILRLIFLAFYTICERKGKEGDRKNDLCFGFYALFGVYSEDTNSFNSESTYLGTDNRLILLI